MALKQRGFTLFEILVAILILGIISVILVTGLQVSINTKARVNDVGDRLAQLQMANTIMSKDLVQVINRTPAVAPNSATSAAGGVFQHRRTGDPISFVRGGYVNPFSTEKRSSLATVTYRFSGDTLSRSVTLDQDPSIKSTPLSQILLTDITRLQWRFLGPDKKFYTTWPIAKFTKKVIFPNALELTIETKGMGKFIRLFMLDSYGLAPAPKAKQKKSGENRNVR